MTITREICLVVLVVRVWPLGTGSDATQCIEEESKTARESLRNPPPTIYKKNRGQSPNPPSTFKSEVKQCTHGMPRLDWSP